MNLRVPFVLKSTLSFLTAFFIVSCSAGNPAPATPTPVAPAARSATPTATVMRPQPATAAPPAKMVKLTILHTNDSRGYVDPCG